MSRITALAATLAILASGCTTGGRVFGGAAVVSTIAAASATSSLLDDHSQGHPETEAGALALLALACAIAGIYFEVARPDTETAAPEPAPTAIPDAAPLVATKPARDPHAAQLTQQAYFAARVGQCTAVKVLGDKVRTTDPTYFDAVFSIDPTISKCL